MFAFLLLALAPIATMHLALNPCPPSSAKACALVESIATEMTQSLAERGLVVGEFRIESFRAAGPVLRIVQRTTYTEREFEKIFAAPGRSSADYLKLLRKATLQINCLEPTRAIVETGGSIEIRILFKDGGVLDEQILSVCPAA